MSEQREAHWERDEDGAAFIKYPEDVPECCGKPTKEREIIPQTAHRANAQHFTYFQCRECGANHAL